MGCCGCDEPSAGFPGAAESDWQNLTPTQWARGKDEDEEAAFPAATPFGAGPISDDSSTGKNCRVTGSGSVPFMTENPNILLPRFLLPLALGLVSSSSDPSSMTTADELELDTDPTRLPLSSSPSAELVFWEEQPSDSSSTRL